MQQISMVKCFGGTQAVYEHQADTTQCAMRFAVYTPPAMELVNGTGNCKFPVLYWLSGLTCTEENFITKSGFQRVAAELGLIVIAPDTSPRGKDIQGDDVPDDPDGAYDFGLGAGFYVDATQSPFDRHYHMYSYITQELRQLVAQHFPVDESRTGIFGHSMGGHGALTLYLKNPDIYKSCSAFSPIVAPSQVPWGQKALAGYLGEDKAAWAAHDATELVKKSPTNTEILIDQGDADQFLAEQLQPEIFATAAKQAGQPLNLRMQPGYDHSYYFIASFIADHLRHHAAILNG